MKGGTIDSQNLLGTDQGAITASAATTNTKNFGVADPDIGASGKGVMRFVVTTPAGGSGSVQFKIQDCDTESGTYQDIAASKDYSYSELTDGAVVEVPFPTENQQYVRGYFEVTGTVSALCVTTVIDPE